MRRRGAAAGRDASALHASAREELRAGDRGAEDVDFDDLDDAAAPELAVAENTAVFHGWPEAGDRGDRRGLATSRAHPQRRFQARTPAA